MAEETDDFRSMCEALGFVVINWALAEMALDTIISVTYDNCGGSTIDEIKPFSLSKKIEFLRKAFSQLVALQPYAKEGVKILDRMDELSPKRHNLVHGVLTSMEPVNGIFPFEKLDYRNKKIEKVGFDPKAFPDLAEDLVRLGREALLFAQALGERFR